MGKQVEFLINKSKEKEMMEYLLNRDYKFLIPDLNENKDIIWLDDFSDILDQFYLLLYKKEYGKINHNEVRVLTLESSVIELKRTSINDKKKQILKGRIWIGNNEPLTNEQMNEYMLGYKEILSWIKKNIPRQEYYIRDTVCKKGYITNEIKEMLENGYSIPY